VMAADHCRGISNLELEAAIYHQLCHLHEDESTDSEGEVTYSPAIRPHDLEMFRSELDRYGFWTQDISAASHHFAKQLKLEFSADKRFESQPNPYESVPEPPLNSGGKMGSGMTDDWTESDEEKRRQRIAEQEADEGATVERELQEISL
jgi:hypothetical protein